MQPVTHLDLSPRDVRQYSLSRLILSLMERREAIAPFELECSREVAKRLDTAGPKGAYVPFDIQRAPPMDTTTAGEGEELVGQDDTQSFTTGLYRNTSILEMGAQTLEGLTGNTGVPRLDDIVAEWLAEGGNATAAVAATGRPEASPNQGLATPHTVSSYIPCTRRLIKQSSPSVDALLTSSFAEVLGAAIDVAAVDGTGDQPTGLSNLANPAVTTSAVAGPTWAELAAFVGSVAGNFAFRGDAGMGWMLSKAAFDAAISTPSETGGGALLYDNMLKFGSVTTHSGLDAGRYCYGRWADALVCFWGVLDISVKNLNAADTHNVYAFLDCDVIFRRRDTFVVNA